MSREPRLHRDKAMLFGCPRCEAPPHIACDGPRGPRVSAHMKRVRAAAEATKGLKGKTARKAVARKVSPQTERDSFYLSPAWRRLRYRVLRAANGACECCGAGPTRESPLHVDHIKPRSRFPELDLDPRNLQVLCEDCNLGKGASDTIDWRKNGRS